MSAAPNNSALYRSFCAPTRKRGTLSEDLSRIFQCDDMQNTETQKARFERGAECIRRRIEEMARHRANTPANRDKRKRHFIPVKLTYGFAKDCLQRYAPDSRVREFERNINKHISRQLGYYRYSIENNIRRGANNSRTLRRVKNLVSPRNDGTNNSAAPRTPIFISNRWTRRSNTNNSNNIFNTNRINKYDNIRVTLTR